MSRIISVEALLVMMDQIEQEFALQAARKKPEGDHTAHYNHGVVVGINTVRENLLEKLKKEEADGNARKPGSITDQPEFAAARRGGAY